MDFSVHSGRSGPYFSELLDDVLVGVDVAKYGEIGATASENEGRAIALFKDLLELGAIVRRDSKTHDNHKPYLE